MEHAFGGTSSHAGRESTPDVLPASQYLQDRLQERRAKNTRPKRARQSDFGPQRTRDDDIFLNEAEESRCSASRAFDSSPMSGMLQGDREGSASNTRRRALGARDLDEHMDRLAKQNFALKLELDHRRDHTAKLQDQIDDMRMQAERAEQLEQEHAELLRINSQLVEELEKRDRAVEEAMDIICELEDNITDMEERSSNTRPSTANADSGYAGTDTHEQAPPSSPPKATRMSKTPQVSSRQPPLPVSAAAGKLTNGINGQTPARPRREPNILSQKKPSTHALRSVYLEAAQSLHPVKSFNSLLTRQEGRIDEDEAVLDSPRLSVLSESSFPSIYSPKGQISPDRFAWEAEDDATMAPTYEPSPHLRQDSIKRVSQWMDDRDHNDETPSKSNKISPPLPNAIEDERPSSPTKRNNDTSSFPSIAKTLSRGSITSVRPSIGVGDGVSYIKPYSVRPNTRLSAKQPRPDSFAGAMFGEPLLPPTPDSASTRMLRKSRSSLANDGERSLLDTTPAAIRGYDVLEPGTRSTPKQFRSSGELNGAHDSYITRGNGDVARNEDEDDDELDARSEAYFDLSPEYDGFPDGSSLIMGTPSRFLKHARTPQPTMSLNGTTKTDVARSPLARRQSSSGASVSPRKPSLSRSETSPTMLPSFTKNAAARAPQSSTGSVTTPRSYHSGSSSNKTVVHPDEQTRAMSPEIARAESRLASNVASPPRPRVSPLPGRTLSQKTQAFFSRKNTFQTDHLSEREKSPLPTLTSTPSSAYVHDAPKEARRPGTGHSGDTNAQVTARPASSRAGSRPAIPTRTITEPTSPRRPSSASDRDRASLFKRRNSMKTNADTPSTSMTAPILNDSEARPGMAKQRRGSFREVVGSAARRPWR
ncbi:hypothetical protein LTR37_000823 [Vermiconidia calcicola]|uniref:Uncharacterized protein n=1 Tax=Vermiconidia calcicola TaxID=1690605 RepID=A0ACC3NY05_9PEZI|nr:hypothetical protein LTR37_000823 [Vermiconidia calcicola]